MVVIINGLKVSILFSILASPLLGGSIQASSTTLKATRSQCYGYLTELVRSSNFPLTYVKKDKANLLIDDDQGETVFAQVVFVTGGPGTTGWVKYDIQSHTFFNISAELDRPQSLTYDKKYAEQYEHCISKN